jgi:hypothetical protein
VIASPDAKTTTRGIVDVNAALPGRKHGRASSRIGIFFFYYVTFNPRGCRPENNPGNTIVVRKFNASEKLRDE